MRTSIPINNFSAGQLDRDIKGRFELSIYYNGAEISRNFFSTIQGNLIFRNGYKNMSEYDNAAIYNFTFNEDQSYLLVFLETEIEFWSYDSDGNLVQVLDGSGDPLSVAHTYGDDRFDLEQRMAQKGDVLYIVHPDHTSKTLTRTASNAFTLANFVPTGITGNFNCITFYESRLVVCPASDPTTIRGSKAADYDNFTTGTSDDDGYEFDIASLNSEILWLFAGKNSLICGASDGIATVNGGGVNVPITPSSVSANLSSSEGASKAMPIEKDGYVIYVSQNKRQLFALSYTVLSESFISTLLNKTSYDITKNGIDKIRYKKDKYDLIYIKAGEQIIMLTFSADDNSIAMVDSITNGVVNDIETVVRPDGDHDLFISTERNNIGFVEVQNSYNEYSMREDVYTGDEAVDDDTYIRLIAEEFKRAAYLDGYVTYDGLQDNLITYDSVAGTITATDDVFSSTDIGREIKYKTETGLEQGIFRILEYVSATVVEVEVEYPPTSDTYQEWYLTASTFSGLDNYIGQTISVVGDGGYIGDFYVDGTASINIEKQVGIAYLGYKYKGIYKTFNYGFASQGVTTQTSPKVIYKVTLRFLFSAGGEFGTSLYNLKPIQEFYTSGLYDNPPLPMDKDVELAYNSSGFGKDKRVVIVQDSPLPLQVAMIVPYFKQVSNT